MRPGALSQGGFLGPDESLAAVLAHDARVLEELGVTADQLGSRLAELVGAAVDSPRRAAQVGVFKIAVKVYTGFQMCPWSPDVHTSQCTSGGGVQFGSIDWQIHNTRTEQQSRGSGLAVHLIRDHSFFEGFQSPYRLEPKDLAQLLEFPASA